MSVLPLKGLALFCKSNIILNVVGSNHWSPVNKSLINFNFAKSYEIVNLSQIAKIKSKNINAEVLLAKGLISSAFVAVKVLGNGDIDKAYNITASAFSASAVKKIEEAGGKVTVQ